jgi:hypothetical protein
VWLPGSQVKLAVVANKCVKVYDLSKDSIAPMYYFTLLEDTVRAACFVQDQANKIIMLLQSVSGMLFVQPLESLSDGPCIITDTIQVCIIYFFSFKGF